MLRTFLWSGVELKCPSAKMKWSQVCTPKVEGGPRLKPLKGWNKATMLIWQYATTLIPCGSNGYKAMSIKPIIFGILGS